MRVGLVCPYSLTVPGGVQSHVVDLAAWLRARGHEVQVLAPMPPGHETPGVTPAGRPVGVPYNGAVARLSFGPGTAARTRAWLAAGGFDVVHLHEPLAPSASMLALLHADAPLVATFHSAADARVLVTAVSGLLRPALARVRVRIAVSSHAAATVAALPGPSPQVVPNGVDVARYAGPGRDAAGERDGRTVAFLGRLLEPRKGLAVLARAVPMLLARCPSARVLVAGPGDVAAVAALFAGEPRVRVLGERSEAEKVALLRRADVYVAPNLGGESFGIILVEAMAAGAAVVASDLPAFRDVLAGGDAGRLVAPDDARVLADAVAALLQHPADRGRLAGAGQARAREFDWSVIGPRVEDAYRCAQAGSAQGGC